MHTTNDADFRSYCVRTDDGRWLYHLPRAGSGSWGEPQRIQVLADGQPMTQLAEKSPWWVTDHEADTITGVFQPGSKTVAYRLKDPTTESAKYPAQITPERWQELYDAASDSDVLYSLYEGIREDQPTYTEDIPGPYTVLDGTEPPAAGSRAWHADIPRSLLERPEFHHQFPGYISGLRDAVSEAAKQMPHVSYALDNDRNRPTALNITMRVPYDQPESHWRPNYSRSTGKELRSGRQVQTMVEVRMTLPVPNIVRADNHAAGLAAFQEQLDFWLGIIRDANVKACNHCRGTGHVLDAHEQAQAR